MMSAKYFEYYIIIVRGAVFSCLYRLCVDSVIEIQLTNQPTYKITHKVVQLSTYLHHHVGALQLSVKKH